MPVDILKKLKSLIKSARVVSSDDTGDYPVIEVTYFGVFRTRILLVSPYGIWGRVPDGAYATVFKINGVESNLGAVANDYPARPVKDKATGEVVVGNSVTKTHILFREDGGITVRAFGDVDVTADGSINATAGGDINATAVGKIKAQATEVELDTPLTKITGNVEISGSLTTIGGGGATISGNVDFTGGTLTHDGVNVGKTHTHPILAGSSAPGPTGGPQ